MTIIIGSNVTSNRVLRHLSQTSSALSTAFERLSSGQRINRAVDDPAALAIAESLKNDLGVYAQAVRNVNDGASLLNIADSTVESLSGIIVRIRELAEQAANGSLAHHQREVIDKRNYY